MNKNRHILHVLLGAAAISAVLTATAAAQFPMPQFSLQNDKKKTPEEIEHDRAIDKAYQSATKKIPDQSGANDPWATVRPAPPPAPARKKSELSHKKQQLSEGGK